MYCKAKKNGWRLGASQREHPALEARQGYQCHDGWTAWWFSGYPQQTKTVSLYNIYFLSFIHIDIHWCNCVLIVVYFFYYSISLCVFFKVESI